MRRLTIVATVAGLVIAIAAPQAIAAPTATAAASKAACIKKAKKKHGKKARAKAIAKCRKQDKRPPATPPAAEPPAAPAPPTPPAQPQPSIAVDPAQVAPAGIVTIKLSNIPAPPAGQHYRAYVTTDAIPSVDELTSGRPTCTFIASKDWINPAGGIVLISSILDGRQGTPWCTGSATASLNLVPDAAPSNYTGSVAYSAAFAIG